MEVDSRQARCKSPDNPSPRLRAVLQCETRKEHYDGSERLLLCASIIHLTTHNGTSELTNRCSDLERLLCTLTVPCELTRNPANVSC